MVAIYTEWTFAVESKDTSCKIRGQKVLDPGTTTVMCFIIVLPFTKNHAPYNNITVNSWYLRNLGTYLRWSDQLKNWPEI